ncbi:hypothetical protein K2173_024984 [Erythroxylum novogranatense]|uniref:Uncharacterized protein n=1 Tax=Erythroxylum novogranatense TaxID=1862640 RepID=A0AAV8UD14_9ROSI|nr:hypothetical protein K2173_024984 [Erythroxylum novogranatense]
MADEIELKTAPADFRFPKTNQTRHCFTRYIEFHRCVAAKGDESNDCERFDRALCPGEWINTSPGYVFILALKLPFTFSLHTRNMNMQRETRWTISLN